MALYHGGKIGDTISTQFINLRGRKAVCVGGGGGRGLLPLWVSGEHVEKTTAVIGLGPRDARFHTLNWKNAHSFQDKCANFASIISRMVNK